MNRFSFIFAKVAYTLIITMISGVTFGQSVQTSTPGVPRLVKFSAQLKDASGNLLTGTVGIAFALYSEQSGGTPLWQETQNVQFAQGRYTVFLGSTTSAGVPAELFASGQSQWLGVQALLPGEEEQPRVLLASVPYALKAVDADTLGGFPPSSYLRTDTPRSTIIERLPLAVTNSSQNGILSQESATTAGSHMRRGIVNGEESGRLSITDSTSASYTFATKWTSPPLCTLTPTSDPHAIGGYWVTTSTSTMIASIHYAGRIAFNFRCQAATSVTN